MTYITSKKFSSVAALALANWDFSLPNGGDWVEELTDIKDEMHPHFYEGRSVVPSPYMSEEDAIQDHLQEYLCRNT